jgi:hypothetical protein
VTLNWAEPLLSDVILSLQTGWTPDQIAKLDAKFVEKLILYLNLIGEKSKSGRSCASNGYRKIFSSEDGLIG